MKKDDISMRLDNKATMIAVELRALVARFESAQFSFHGREAIKKMGLPELNETSRVLTDAGGLKNQLKALVDEMERAFDTSE